LTDDLRGSLIGARIARPDAEAKLTGSCRFLSDMRFGDLLHARQVPSPAPHARLLGLDCRAAREAPGVRALITAAEVPGENRVGVIYDDQPLFAEEKVRYVGEAMAVVAAESEEEATAAAALVEARLEALPALLSLDDVEANPEHPIHSGGPIAVHHRVSKGNVARGFAEAAQVVDATFRTGSQEHYYLEPLGCVALPGDRGGVTLLASCQCPFYIQKAVARTAGLPLGEVRVVQTPTGGAFGGKEDVPSEICARAALLALATGRPVRLLLERREDIAYSSKRHPYTIRGRLAARADGRFTAIEIHQDAEAGAYATLSPPVLYRSAMQAAGPYEIPHVKVEARAWYTNQAPSGAFRGFGSPQATFAHERLVDLMASELGTDPVELRRINLLREGGTTGTGHRLDASVGALETLERCAAAVPAEEATAKSSPALREDPGRWLLGTGYGSMIYGNCLGKAGWHMDGAGATLQLHRDGSLSCAVGLTEIGQGAEVVVTQFAADALGALPEQVTLLPVDTAFVPDSGPTVASRNVVMSGNAILDAAKQLRSRLSPLAAELLGCAEGEAPLFEAGRVHSGERELSLAELAEEAFQRNVNLAAEGWWHAPPLDFDLRKGRGEAYFAYSFATQAARVAVDRLTGQVKVLGVWAAHDVGRAVNPAGIEGQVEGGVAQGVGWAIGERVACEGGRILSDNLSTYALPTALEVPEVETIIVESPHPDGPHGAKSLGEPCIIPTAAAVANAIGQAIGSPVDSIPVDPEEILLRLEEVGLG